MSGKSGEKIKQNHAHFSASLNQENSHKHRDKMTISTDTQIRYIVQWFEEWSELQRSDFLPVLVEYYGNKPYMNGVVNSISNVEVQDKPMSLFQCRVKLFKEWIPQWSTDHKEHLLKQLQDIDVGFHEKFQEEVQNGTSYPVTNGIGGTDELLED